MPITREEITLDTEGNGERIRSLEFDIADAPMLRHAMSIAVATAMMCSGAQAQARLRYYQRKFTELCPPGYQHLRREEDLSEIAIAMNDAPTWSIEFEARPWRDEGEAIIRVGSRSWSVWSISRPNLEQLTSCINAIAPLSCMQIDPTAEEPQPR